MEMGCRHGLCAGMKTTQPSSRNSASLLFTPAKHLRANEGAFVEKNSL